MLIKFCLMMEKNNNNLNIAIVLCQVKKSVIDSLSEKYFDIVYVRMDCQNIYEGSCVNLIGIESLAADCATEYVILDRINERTVSCLSIVDARLRAIISRAIELSEVKNEVRLYLRSIMLLKDYIKDTSKNEVSVKVFSNFLLNSDIENISDFDIDFDIDFVNCVNHRFYSYLPSIRLFKKIERKIIHYVRYNIRLFKKIFLKLF